MPRGRPEGDAVPITVAGGLFAALMVAAASLAARGTTAFPASLVTTGFVLAVLLLLSVAFFPLIALPLWVLLVAVTVGRPTR